MQDPRVSRLQRRLDDLERLVRDIEVDVAAIIRELRLHGLPELLRDRTAYVGHRAVLTPDTRRTVQSRNCALARASKSVGVGRGAVRDPAVKRKLRKEIDET